MTGLPHRKGPCRECPWRTDVEPGQFPAERYEALRETSEQPEVTSMDDILRQPMFACHKSVEGLEAACAGWLASMGHQNLRIRYAVVTGQVPVEALSPGDDWPELFGSYEEMAARQAARDETSQQT